MSKKYNKPWLSEEYKARVCMNLILQFLRSRETDTSREWGTSTKEFRLVDFQQWIGKQITPDDLVDNVLKSQWKWAVAKRKYRAKLKEKADYEAVLNQMREDAKKNSKKIL